MQIHPRISLHQDAFAGEPTATFVEHCQSIDVTKMTMSATQLMRPGELDAARVSLAGGGAGVHTIIHAFAHYPDLERDDGRAAEQFEKTLSLAANLEASNIYLVTGGRGALSWEAAAERFAQLLAPGIRLAEDRGVRLLVEPASGFNADIHIAHTLGDAIMLAELAGIGLCVDLHPCWFESGLKQKLLRAIPNTGLVQVSDYVSGDRSAPCRAVPGDGMIPIERLIGDILDCGYEGVFDLELVGPRIAKEGARAATRRAAEQLSRILNSLGA